MLKNSGQQRISTIYKERPSTYPWNKIPVFDGGTSWSYHDCSADHYMILVYGTTWEELKLYLSELADHGFVQRSQNRLGNVQCYTYLHKDDTLLYLYRVEHSGEVRLIMAEHTSLPVKENPAKPFCAPFIHQFDASGTQDGENEGMGYILRMRDGRFLIIDGGYPCDQCADQIYNFLKQSAPNPDHIEIAGWIITHAHRDHAGGFITFIQKYYKDSSVILQRVLYNICLEKEMVKYADIGLSNQILDFVRKCYPDAIIHTPLTGQKYQFSGADIEIFHTVEDYMPYLIPNEADATPLNEKKGDGNVQSVAFRVNFEVGSFFVMADSTTICCNEMCRRYGNTMKSDYVQMAHHGLSCDRPRAHNATKEIYDLINPDFAFLPCSKVRYADRMKYEVNSYLERKVRKIYISGLGADTVFFDS